jgi:hypothetical protein
VSNAHVGGFGPGKMGRLEQQEMRRRMGRAHFTLPRKSTFRSSLHTSLWLVRVVLIDPRMVVDHV